VPERCLKGALDYSAGTCSAPNEWHPFRSVERKSLHRSGAVRGVATQPLNCPN
jgi:hypothetical protein